MSKIVKTSQYLPRHLVSNDDLISQHNLDSTNEWIIQRTGIESRYVAKEESLAQMAIEAAKQLIEDDLALVDRIQLIIVASMSSKLPTPSLANQVQSAIGAKHSWGFDINGACSAFVMALDIAEKFAQQYKDGYTLVIGAEKMSQILNYQDRGSCILFGDGAGAILIQNDGQSFKDYKSQLYNKEDLHDGIVVSQATEEKMAMNGKEVLNFVNRTVIPSLGHFIDQNQIDFDYLVCHQANRRILEMMAKKLKISMEKIPCNIDKVANLSAASIPVLLHSLVEANEIHLDETKKFIICGFGAGLSWGQLTLSL